MATSTDGTDEGHLDLVPMIDCIMLLLLFFMMTTKFSPVEESIASLLPTNQGPGVLVKDKEPPRTITVAIYPAGITRGFQPSDYVRQLAALQPPGQVIEDAYLRIGSREPFLISGKLLNGPDVANPQGMPELVDRIHRYLADELSNYETPDVPRDKQPDILMSCFSGLSWKFALIAYDGVRAYEGTKGHITDGDPEKLMTARAVTFTPPRIRVYTAHELGDELYEIVHHR